MIGETTGPGVTDEVIAFLSYRHPTFFPRLLALLSPLRSCLPRVGGGFDAPGSEVFYIFRAFSFFLFPSLLLPPCGPRVFPRVDESRSLSLY